MEFPLSVPELVHQRALANGAAGRRWLERLPELVSALAARWDLRLGQTLDGGTASYVVTATDGVGRACVLKLGMPLDTDEPDAFARSVRVHQLADGRGCAKLFDHDLSIPAMLLERLGPNLHDLKLPLPRVLDVIAATLHDFWRPVGPDSHLPTGADKAAWLARYVDTTWMALGRPCDRAVIDRAIALCDRRASAFDREARRAGARRRPRMEHPASRARGVQVRRSGGTSVRSRARPQRGHAGVQPSAARWGYGEPRPSASRIVGNPMSGRCRRGLGMGLCRAGLDRVGEPPRAPGWRRPGVPRGRSPLPVKGPRISPRPNHCRVARELGEHGADETPDQCGDQEVEVAAEQKGKKSVFQACTLMPSSRARGCATTTTIRVVAAVGTRMNKSGRPAPRT